MGTLAAGTHNPQSGDAYVVASSISSTQTAHGVILLTIDNIVDAILEDTDTAIPGLIAALNNVSSSDVETACGTALATYDPPTKAEVDASVAALLTTQMTESYNTDGTAPTVAQALFVIMQRLTEFAISSTTITVKKLDGTTSAFTLTLDDATKPTSSKRET